MKSTIKASLLMLLFSLFCFDTTAQHSVAREWNEMLLASIRKDFARPTVHARNLFHTSIAMYDAWAAYDSVAQPFMLGDTIGSFACPFTGVPAPSNIDSARNEAISYAAYRLLKYRFRNSPGVGVSGPLQDSLFLALGYDSSYHSTNYASGPPAALGNYIAQQLIAFGLQDGANEQNNYANQYYSPINPPLVVKLPGNPDMIDPNRWQPLALGVFIDQAGNVIILPNGSPPFLSPEWGNVVPFSLTDSIKTVYTRDSSDYWVYHDPGTPPHIDTLNGGGLADDYKWTFALVSTWSSHLDPSDSVMWDISPASIGNIPNYPTSFTDHRNFYDLLNGGDPSLGYTVNPKTGQPYAPQIVPRGDYTRVLAEFWADGPNSETPPGHWFTILNYVNDHPQFQKKWRGHGPVIDDLEWDVKAYLTLGGAMHDVAIVAWGIKGWYDYTRPVSALRYMADQGQSSDTSLANYSPKGIPLIPGYIEVVDTGDALAGSNNTNVGKIKLKAWRGPDYITDPAVDEAGVGWILAENWWPYQRPTFVTPPFAGYISGHSTYSRTAAEVLSFMTGDEYFPGGLGEFPAPKNEFLVFEEGPSVDLTLQWAKYKDASDQCSLSRIWGGIHPPADDIPGRLIGMQLGPEVLVHAEKYFDDVNPEIVAVTPNKSLIADADTGVNSFTLTLTFSENMDTNIIPAVTFPIENPMAKTLSFNSANSSWTDWITYVASYDVVDSSETLMDIDVRITNAQDIIGNGLEQHDEADAFSIDMQNPNVVIITPSKNLIADSDTGLAAFTLTIVFDADMNNANNPVIEFPVADPLGKTLTYNNTSSWTNSTTFTAVYDVADSSETLNDIDVKVQAAKDVNGNDQLAFVSAGSFSIDTRNPNLVSVTASTDTITSAMIGTATFELTMLFDEDMDNSFKPTVLFPVENPIGTVLSPNISSSVWLNATTFSALYDVAYFPEKLTDIDVAVDVCEDLAGNGLVPFSNADKFSINIQDTSVGIFSATKQVLNIYPNPVSNNQVLTIALNEATSDLHLQLYNCQGTIINSRPILQNQKTVKIEIESIPQGIYLLRLYGSSSEWLAKIQVLN